MGSLHMIPRKTLYDVVFVLRIEQLTAAKPMASHGVPRVPAARVSGQASSGEIRSGRVMLARSAACPKQKIIKTSQRHLEVYRVFPRSANPLTHPASGGARARRALLCASGQSATRRGHVT